MGQANINLLLRPTSLLFYVSYSFFSFFFKLITFICLCGSLTLVLPDAIMAVGMILLNEKFEVFDEYKFQKYAPMVGLALVVLDFGYLLSIFRMKYQGYPYR